MNPTGGFRFQLHCPRCGYPVGECQARSDECTRLHMESPSPQAEPQVQGDEASAPDHKAARNFWCAYLGGLLVLLALGYFYAR